jgi:thiosulfate/3-mercaptopyruvate sulfurtransferase
MPTPSAPYTTLISASELQSLKTAQAPLLVFDCSFELMDPAAADRLFTTGRIAGAIQAHLERHLSASSPDQAINGGRHPLPRREWFARWLREAGLNQTDQVVVYDRNGANYCGRLWWMLKWAGHEAVAVLDGGLQAWQAIGGPLESGPATPQPAGDFQLSDEKAVLVTTQDLARALGRPGQTIIDARAGARFRGEIEPLDPVAGHIPGALNRPFGRTAAARRLARKNARRLRLRRRRRVCRPAALQPARAQQRVPPGADRTGHPRGPRARQEVLRHQQPDCAQRQGAHLPARHRARHRLQARRLHHGRPRPDHDGARGWKRAWPEVPIHLSVQANTTNYATVKFWQKAGRERASSFRAS